MMSKDADWSKCPVAHSEAESGGKLENGDDRAGQRCPMMNSEGTSSEGCPMSRGAPQGLSGVFADYGNDQNSQSATTQLTEGNRINPSNNMPAIAEQKPWPGQSISLSTNRVESVIPKGEYTPDHQNHLSHESSSWIYPSEQQFFNAMKRKGWQPREEDMRVVVSIHNHVNDTAWSEIMKFEEMHMSECKDGPRLVRFMGRPKDLSPKAYVRSMLGFQKPFDRHDWIIDRCGKEIRYVIDFYKGAPPDPSSGKLLSLHLDARPALDSFEAFKDRVKLSARETFSSWFGSSADR